MNMPQNIAGVVRRLILAVGRGRISQSDDSGPVQFVQVVLNPLETPDLRRIAEYGFASWPPDKCDAVVVFLSGDRSNGAVIATHDLASRFKLGNKGESALFDNSGDQGKPGRWLWFKLGDTPTIELEAKNTPVNIKDASEINITPPAGGTTVINIKTSGGAVTLDMGGGDILIKDPGSVVLSDQNGEKAVVRDGDPVSTGGHVNATQNAVKA